MKDLDDMTPEEIRAWAEGQRQESRRRFAGQPEPHISPVKRDDYPHWHLQIWLSRVVVGVPAWVRRGGGSGSATGAVTRGMRTVSDKGPHALLVDVDSAGLWALRRADGRAWTNRVDGDPATVTVEVLDMPVVAWNLPEGGLPDAEVRVPAPSESEDWTLRTVALEETV